MAADFYLGRKGILFEGGKFLEFGSSILSVLEGFLLLLGCFF